MCGFLGSITKSEISKMNLNFVIKEYLEVQMKK